MAHNLVAARSVQGSLHLRFARRGGRTVLDTVERGTPWSLQRLLYLNPGAPALATATLLNSTAGLFAGDRLSLAVEAASGAAVVVRTPTQSRVYAMPDGEAATNTRLEVEDGALLCYLPEPLLLCRDAALTQRITLRAGPAAWAAAGEVLAFGRAGHGELHAYRRLDQRSEVYRGGRLLLADALLLDRGGGPDALGAAGGFAAYGSQLMLCPEGHARALLEVVRSLLPSGGAAMAGASFLPEAGGITLRVLAPSATAAQLVLRDAATAFLIRAQAAFAL